MLPPGVWIWIELNWWEVHEDGVTVTQVEWGAYKEQILLLPETIQRSRSCEGQSKLHFMCLRFEGIGTRPLWKPHLRQSTQNEASSSSFVKTAKYYHNPHALVPFFHHIIQVQQTICCSRIWGFFLKNTLFRGNLGPKNHFCVHVNRDILNTLIWTCLMQPMRRFQ